LCEDRKKKDATSIASPSSPYRRDRIQSSHRQSACTSRRQALTGNDWIEARTLFKDYRKFRNRAKLIFAANEVPRTEIDFSDAFFRRFSIIEFPHTFKDGDPNTDVNLLEKLTTQEELSGILNWALEGLLRLLKNKCFTEIHDPAVKRSNYIHLSDSVNAFEGDELIFDSITEIPKDEMYTKYVNYCVQNKYAVESKKEFNRRLPSYVAVEEHTTKNDDSKYVKIWRGAHFKNDKVQGKLE
jgi:putative DNA primase/helicase